MKNIMKSLLLTLSIPMFFCAHTESSYAEEHAKGYLEEELPTDVDQPKIKSTVQSQLLPSKYDHRIEERTKVKNQGSRGLCTYFASTGALESTTAKQLGENYYFSELYADYLNASNATGIEGENPLGYNRLLGGSGNNLQNLYSSMRWRLPVLESEMPYNSGAKADPNIQFNKSPKVHVQGIYTVLNLATPYTELEQKEKILTLKKHIIDTGSLSTSLASRFGDESVYNKKNAAFYTDKNIGGRNHATLIVGWDDDYSKENFVKKPKNNGAFIVKNSWGSGWGDKGYYYVSYEDYYIATSPQQGVSKVEASDNYDYQYNHADFWSDSNETVRAEEYYLANRYVAKTNEELKAISFNTMQLKTPYTMYVSTDKDINNTQKYVEVGKGVQSEYGQETVQLSKTIELKPNQPFYVIVKFNKPKGVSEAHYRTETAQQSYAAKTHPNETYVAIKDGDKKLIFSEKNYNVYVAGYTKAIKNITLSTTKSVNKPTVKVGESVEYTVTATNIGNTEAKNTQYTETLPKEMEKPTEVTLLGSTGTKYPLREGSENPNSSGEYYTWDDSSHTLTVYATGIGKAGGKKSLVYQTKVLAGNDEQVLENKGTISAANLPEKQNVSAKTTVVGVPSLSTTKSVNKPTVKVGETVEYTVTATNIGNTEAKNIQYTETLPKEMEKPTEVTLLGSTGTKYPLREGSENPNSSGEYYTWDDSSHTLTVYATGIGKAGGKKSLVYQTKVLAGNDEQVLENKGTISAANLPEKQNVSAKTTVVGVPSLSTTKSVNKPTVKVGETVEYTVTATNIGNTEAKNIQYTETLPKEMEKPTEVTLLGSTGTKYPLREGSENPNSSGEYYTWDDSSHTLTVYATGIGKAGGKKSLVYQTKVLAGNDEQVLENIGGIEATNLSQKLTVSISIEIL